MDKVRPQDPMATVRQQLILALVYSALCLAVCITAFGLIDGWEAATAAFIGGMIILVPSVWLAYKVASARGPHYAMASAMVKFALCGLGAETRNSRFCRICWSGDSIIGVTDHHWGGAAQKRVKP
ncbi:ATP synthase subunit I [Luminiphilus sp.]|nr:ATP synthase subunit I [Luminiphilus sp.]